MAHSTIIRVISLTGDSDRQSQFAARAAEATVPWSFFSAHESLQPPLVHDGELPAVRRGRMLSERELACYSSHYGVWREFLSTKNDQLVVLEDDAWVDWGFLEQLIQQDLGSIGIEYLKLSSTNLPPRILKGKLLGRYVAHFLGYPQGAVGYVLTRAGAEKLLDHCRLVAGPIDIVMDQTWWGGLPALCLFPCPVVEKTGPSRIGSDRYSSSLSLPRRLRFRRQLLRIQEKVRLTTYVLLARLGVVGPRTLLDRRWM